MVNSRFVIILTFACCMSTCNGFITRWTVPPLGTITVLKSKNSSAVLTVIDQPAEIKLETAIPEILEGFLIAADPPNACRKLSVPPAYTDDDEIDPGTESDYPEINFQRKRQNDSAVAVPVPRHWIVIADKTECSYQAKVEYAQLAGYAGLIIHNVGSNKMEVIGYNDPTFDLLIPAYFIGENDGVLLRNNFTYQAERRNQYIIRISTDTSFYHDVVVYILWTFVILVCVIVMICSLKPCYYSLVQPSLRRRNDRLKRTMMIAAVDALPIIEWETSHREKFETCVICMEEFLEKDWVRILRCSHGFHMACIDAWLLKVRRNCPSCKASLLKQRWWARFSESDISEGNYLTDMAYEPTLQNPRRHHPSLDDSDEFVTVTRHVLSRRRTQVESWSSTSTLTSNYSTALSTDEASPSTVSCTAVIHSSSGSASGSPPSTTEITNDLAPE